MEAGMLYFSTILISVSVTISLIPVMIKLAGRLHMIDIPDPRKVHNIPIPRIGGLAMALGAFIPILIWAAPDKFARTYLAGAAILVLFGMLDDMVELGYKAKFTGQILAASLVVFPGGARINSLGTLLPGVIHLPELFYILLSIVVIVGVTNAINLADGLDGLAGGISLLIFCCIAYLAYLAESDVVVILSLALAGSIFGFLRYNTHPASLFMGDTGSQFLGFSAIVLAIRVTQGYSPFSPLLPLVILGFPVLDTLTVMVERARANQPLFSADKKHFHHRLINIGLSHAEAVFTIYVIQALMIISAVFFRYYLDWVLVTFYMICSTLIVIAFTLADRTGFQIARGQFINNRVRGKFNKMRSGSNWIRKISFFMTKTIPVFFIVFCFIPADVPRYASVIAACFTLGIMIFWLFAKENMGFILRFVLYMIVPLVLYLVKEGRTTWINMPIYTIYHLSFFIIAIFAFFTAKYARNKKRFRLTTMDFLVIFIAIIVPNLPNQLLETEGQGLLAVEIIIMLFSYEVLISELRRRIDILAVLTITALSLIVIRGITGV